MTLNFNSDLVAAYTSRSQIARILTEDWVLHNSYCPSCSDEPLGKFENNRPVADFYCKKCNEEFELKSKKGNLANKIADGAYATFIERINAENNPNFFFLTYTKNLTVNDFLIIPKQFFTPEIIIKRPPLSIGAKRAGWEGCHIDISKIADVGKIFLVKREKIISKSIVKQTFQRTLFLRKKSKETKVWLLDVMNCIDVLKTKKFTLDELYTFEQKLALRHPNNNFIKDKIRQQLQILRDKGMVEFLGRGNYMKAAEA